MVDRKSFYEAVRLSEEFRANHGIDNLAPLNIFDVAENTPRLTVVFYPLGDNISGMCLKQGEYSVIAVNSLQSRGRQRFTLAHEFYHLHYDKTDGTIICPKDAGQRNDVEWQADTFASYLLLPYHALRNELKVRGIGTDTDGVEYETLLCAIVEIEQKFRISRMALLVRLQREGVINEAEKAKLSSQVRAEVRRLGYPTALYEPTHGTDAKKAQGDYVDRIYRLFGSNLISQEKAEQLLADGFRDDIWIETIEGGEMVD
ncbi:ImmA/IrrE family metallo-endopeptidase [Eggerthella sp. YY7918]|uniref:ImmA/IrrE family metallo-endopeptidase n=1 Tax=Eggerthella sp. (strain YY7918) TaxID=502558 RepID=UPI00021713FD|nr:ImmA/IrrE family metallo-endopeptidase [Eggerthella sp. YY7918]BAK44858.1 predicted Zn peptidase [Eggerthella sp. YY7918]